MQRFALIATVLVLLAPAVAADDIVLADGKTVKGVRISGETYEVVEYRKPGVSTPQKVASSEVVSIDYERSSKSYRDAMAARDDGNLKGSIHLLLAAAEDERYGEHQQARALVEAAEAMVNLGLYVDAMQKFDELLELYPKTRHLGRALLGKGKAALRKGEFSKASANFDDLKSQAAAKGLGERWTLEAEFFALLTGEGSGKTAGLAAKYESLKGKAKGKYTGLANKCTLRIGKLRLAENDGSGARRLFGEIIDGRLETDRDVVASAYNGRGRALEMAARGAYGEGDAETANALYREALLDFLRVYVHYGDVRDQQPEAMFFAAQCFKNLGDGEVADAGLNSRRLLHQCKTEFETSAWGQEAAKQLR